jgi:hypothetical protein
MKTHVVNSSINKTNEKQPDEGGCHAYFFAARPPTEIREALATRGVPKKNSVVFVV